MSDFRPTDLVFSPAAQTGVMRSGGNQAGSHQAGGNRTSKAVTTLPDSTPDYAPNGSDLNGQSALERSTREQLYKEQAQCPGSDIYLAPELYFAAFLIEIMRWDMIDMYSDTSAANRAGYDVFVMHIPRPDCYEEMQEAERVRYFEDIKEYAVKEFHEMGVLRVNLRARSLKSQAQARRLNAPIRHAPISHEPHSASNGAAGNAASVENATGEES